MSPAAKKSKTASKQNAAESSKAPAVLIRAIRLELARPLGASWGETGALLRTLAKATPKLLNAAMDTHVAASVVGKDAVKKAVAPTARAATTEGIAYQSVLRAKDALRDWGASKNHPFATLDPCGGMMAAVSRAASQAFAARDKDTRVSFASERILVRKSETELTADDRGFVLTVKLESTGRVRFAIAHSTGGHRDTLAGIVAGTIPHGDCKIQWDDRRRTWYALLAYQCPVATPDPKRDPNRALAVHRGVRNAVYVVTSDGKSASWSGSKFIAQRRALQIRQRDIRRAAPEERGSGSRGHGRTRRYASYEALGDKVARVTHTFCQQTAAFVARLAQQWGCGLVIIEDYGGIAPDVGDASHLLIERFPLHELKASIVNRLQRDGVPLREASSAYISSTCPRCETVDERQHNVRTNVFHCRVCAFERPADWVAAFWLLDRGGADMTEWRKRLARERELAARLRGQRDGSDKAAE